MFDEEITKEYQPSKKQDTQLQEDLKLSEADYKALKKKLKQFKSRDDKAYMDMLRTTVKSHYTLNQMIDRKARNMISINTVLISLVIGIAIGQDPMNFEFNYPLLILGFGAIISVGVSIMAMLPEATHGDLTGDDILKKKGNPLFFGNFINLPEQVYENAMIEMVNDRDFVYRSMIQEIYHLGQILERKRRLLSISLYGFIAGLVIASIMTLILKCCM